MTLEDTESFIQSRKLQISGGSTFIISLPKTWVENLNLKAGDSISIIKNANNSLTFVPDSLREVKTSYQVIVTISPKDSEESIKRKIIAIYLAGYKSIKISSKGVKLRPNQTKVIRNLTRSIMIGTEIVESDSESMVIQILTRLPELSFDTALKRMHTMTVSLHKEAIDALIECNKTYAEEIVKLDDEIDRFSLYILRNLTMAVQDASILQEMSLSKPSDCLIYRTVISRIERIADHGTLIAKRVKYMADSIDDRMSKKIRDLSEMALKVFEKSIKALTKNDYILAEQISDEIPKIVEKQEELMISLKDITKNSTVIKFVLDDIRRTAEYSNDITEVVMDKNIHNIITEN